LTDISVMKKWILYSCILCLFLGSQSVSEASVLNERDTLLTIQKGTASFYGKLFHQKKTASGETFDMNEMTAAHKHLPFGTRIKVTNLTNGKQVIVKVNDRLPPSSSRVIDLSRGAARRLEMISDGLAPVKLDALSFKMISTLINYYDEIPAELRLRRFFEPIQHIQNYQYIFQAPFVSERMIR
jgi:rare lipoprotein A